MIRKRKLVTMIALAGLAFGLLISHGFQWRLAVLVLKLRGSLPSVGWVDLARIELGPRSPWTVPLRERVTLGQYNDFVEREHVARYEFAKKYCRGKVVADMACGTCYGMRILEQVAARVDGYDKELLCNNRIIDLDRLSWSEKYDVIVSLETIEHLTKPEFFLQNVHQSAKLFIVSAPIGETRGRNPYHKQVWSLSEFKALLETYFVCRYYSQVGESIEELSGAQPQYLICVCSPRT